MKTKLIHFFFILFFSFFNVQSYASIIYVDANQTAGSQDGTSWENAFSDLQLAIQTATYGDEIWISQGTYYPTAGTSRFASFTLINGVKLYGGFSGVETNLIERNWEMNPTILSGDIGITQDSTDNSYTVVFCSIADTTTYLDGLIIMGGNANGTSGQGTSRQKSGGGLYIYNSSGNEDAQPLITNCTFISNNAVASGGGCFIQNTSNGGASPLFRNCIFEENVAVEGGGLSIRGGSEHREINLSGCIMENNKAVSGGGIYFYNNYGTNNVVIDSCNFVMNYAQVDAGAINLEKYNVGSKLFIYNSSFRFNVSEGEGFAIVDFNFTDSLGMKIKNCLFDGNGDNGSSNGVATISIYEEPVMEIDNCIFRNTVTDGTGAIRATQSDLNISNCLFHNLVSNENPSVLRMLVTSSSNHTVLFTNCTFAKNSGFESRIALSNNQINLSLFNCIFYDNFQSDLVKPFDLDEESNITISNSLLDLPDCASLSDAIINCGSGMLYNADPIFLDTTANDYRLQSCSPARNAGDNNLITQQTLLTDLQGNNRILEDIVDMGAYETLPYELQLQQSIDLTCNNDSSGIINLNVQSACEPLVLYLNQDSIAEGSSPFILNDLSAGNYNFTAIDAQGREHDLEVVIQEPAALEIEMDATPIVCINATNGTAASIVEGGTPPYSYEWQNGITDSLLTDLGAGTYPLTVTDNNECTEVEEVTITESTPISLVPVIVAASGATNADGSVSIDQISGGTAPYTFSWSTGDTTQIISGLLPDDYDLLVTDALGCVLSIILVVDFEVSVEEALNDQEVVNIYPNPVKAGASFRTVMENGGEENWTAQLLDIRGAVLWEKAIDVGEDFFLAPRERGVYILLLIGGEGGREVLRVVVE